MSASIVNEYVSLNFSIEIRPILNVEHQVICIDIIINSNNEFGITNVSSVRIDLYPRQKDLSEIDYLSNEDEFKTIEFKSCEFTFNFGYNMRYLPDSLVPQFIFYYFDKNNKAFNYGWFSLICPIFYSRYFIYDKNDENKILFAFDSNLLKNLEKDRLINVTPDVIDEAYLKGCKDGYDSAYFEINSNKSEKSSINDSHSEHSDIELKEINEDQSNNEIEIQEIETTQESDCSNNNVINGTISPTFDELKNQNNLRKLEIPFAKIVKNVSDDKKIDESVDNITKKRNETASKYMRQNNQNNQQQTTNKILSEQDKKGWLFNMIMALATELNKSDDDFIIINNHITNFIDYKNLFFSQDFYHEIVKSINSKNLSITVFFNSSLFNQNESNLKVNVLCKFNYSFEIFKPILEKVYDDFSEKVNNNEINPGTIKFFDIPEFFQFKKLFSKFFIGLCVHHIIDSGLYNKIIYINKEKAEFIINKY
jgi:hypothetical protein